MRISLERAVFVLCLFAGVIGVEASAQDLGYNPAATCKTAMDNELARGATSIPPSAPPNPVMKDFYGTSSFRREYSGMSATIIYLCEGPKTSGGEVKGQLVYLIFDSEYEVQREFERQRGLLEQQLGMPCWDPAHLNQKQQAFLNGTGQKFEARPGAAIIWRLKSGLYTDLSWGKWHTGDSWNVVIGTHPAPVTDSREPGRTLYDLSNCFHADSGAGTSTTR